MSIHDARTAIFLERLKSCELAIPDHEVVADGLAKHDLMNLLEFARHERAPLTSETVLAIGPPTIDLVSLLVLASASAAYIGKKAVDVAADVLKQWFTERLKANECQHQTVTLYGAHGQVLSIVECDQAPVKH